MSAGFSRENLPNPADSLEVDSGRGKRAGNLDAVFEVGMRAEVAVSRRLIDFLAHLFE